MIFILTESVMNGTVTMDIITSGIEADTWEEARAVLKSLPGVRSADIRTDDNTEVTYYKDAMTLGVQGIMKNEPLNMVDTTKIKTI